MHSGIPRKIIRRDDFSIPTKCSIPNAQQAFRRPAKLHHSAEPDALTGQVRLGSA
ncbi:MAG: hypothetical protein ABFC84_01995 [Veillonellales bacterium]